MTTLTFEATGVGSPDNWTLIAGASKVAAIATPDDDNSSYISSTTTDENVQTFTCSPSLPSGATISQVSMRVRAKRGGASNASFVMGYSFAKQGSGTQSGESGSNTSTSSWADFTYDHSGLSANWGSGFTFYLRNTQTRLVYVTSVEVEFTYTALVIAPSGIAAGATFGTGTVWNHKVIIPVAAGNDDALEAVADGAMSLTNTNITVNSAFLSGMKFRDVLVPPEAAVSASKIQVHPAADYGDSPGLTIRGEIDPADFTTTNSDLSDRTPTTEGVEWTDTDIGFSGYRDSPDISAVLEEMFDDPAWAAGDDVGLLLTDNGTGGALFAHSWNYSSGLYPPKLVIEWDFAPPVLDIAPSGTAVGVAFGTAAVGRGAVVIDPDGLTAAAAFGTAVVGRGAVNIAPSGLAVAAAFGTAAVSRTIEPDGIAAAATFGAARVANVIAPDGIEAAAAFGTAVVGRGAVSIAPSGLAVAATLGGAVVTNAGALIRPDGMAIAATIGDATVAPGAVDIEPSGMAVTVGIGTASVGHGLAATGLGVGVAFGSATVVQGIVPIAPAGIAVGVTFGTATVGAHVVVVAVSSDGYEDGAGNVFLLTTSLNVNSGTPFVAYRMTLTGVPAAATIVDFHLELYPITYDDPILEAYLEAAANPAALSTTTHDLSDRTPTGNKVVWSATNLGTSGHISSPNLAASLQEVVELPGWAGVVVVVMRDTGAGGWLRNYSSDAGASFRPRASVTWAYGAAPLEIIPSGLAVAVGIGEPVITTGEVGIEVDDGTAVAIAFGTAVVAGGVVDIAPEGIEVAAVVGEPVITGGAEDIAPEGIEVAVAMGTPAVGHGLRLSGMAVAVAFGELVVGRGAMGITAEGFAVGVAIGEPVVSAGGAVIQVPGVDGSAEFGTAVVGRGTVGIAASGMAVGVTMGDATVQMVITPEGIAVGVALGDATVRMVIAPSGMAVAVGIGGATVGRGAVDIAPDGQAVAAGFGTAVIGLGGVAIAPEGIEAAAVFGDADVAITTQYIRPAGLSVGAIIGTLIVIAATTPDSRIYRVPRRVET